MFTLFLLLVLVHFGASNSVISDWVEYAQKAQIRSEMITSCSKSDSGKAVVDDLSDEGGDDCMNDDCESGCGGKQTWSQLRLDRGQKCDQLL